MAFNKRLNRLFPLFLIFSLTILSCSKGKLDWASSWIPERAFVVFSGTDTTHPQMPEELAFWSNALQITEFYLVRCRISQGEYEWLLIGTSDEVRELPSRYIARAWSYKGASMHHIQHPGATAPITYGRLAGVHLLSLRGLLVEEAVERRFKYSSSWSASIAAAGANGHHFFWDSRLSAYPWIPKETGIYGILSAGTSVLDTGSRFPFHPLSTLSPHNKYSFPYHYTALIPEDAQAFTFPYIPGKLPTNALLRVYLSDSYPLRVQLLSGNDASERRTSALLFRTVWDEKTRSDFYKRHTARTRSYQAFTLRQLSDPGLKALKGLFQNKIPWLLELDGVIVLAESPDLLERWVDYYRAGATLDQRLLEVFPAPAERGLYWSYQELPDRLPSWMEGKFPVKGYAISTIQEVGKGWALNVKKTSLKVEDASNNALLVWRKAFAKEVARFFPMEGLPWVAIQLTDYTVLVLDATSGDTKLSFKPDGPLVGNIYRTTEEVDKTPGWLMNTRMGIFKINDAAEAFPGFPIRLRAMASTGLTFMPGYGGVGGTFYFPSDNERIYGYALDGSPIGAWNPGPEIGTVTTPLVAFMDGGKDYICGLTASGRLFALSAQAQLHFPALQLEQAVMGSLSAEVSEKSKRLIVFDSSSRVQVVNLQGVHFPLRLGQSTGSQLGVEQLTGDARKDYVLLESRAVALWGYEGTRFRKIWMTPLDTPADALLLTGTPAQRYIALGRYTSRSWQLLDGAGKELPGSPIGGTLGMKWSTTGEVISVLDNTVVCWKMPEVH